MKVGVISVKDGKIFARKDGILTLDLKTKDRPLDEVKKTLKCEAEYIAGAGGMDIFLAKDLNAEGEWAKPADKRLEILQDKIIPHLRWIGLL